MVSYWRKRTAYICPGTLFVVVARHQLVKVNIYITSFNYFAEMNAVYNELIPEPKPPVHVCALLACLLGRHQQAGTARNGDKSSAGMFVSPAFKIASPAATILSSMNRMMQIKCCLTIPR
jgi:hypothetical protein